MKPHIYSSWCTACGYLRSEETHKRPSETKLHARMPRTYATTNERVKLRRQDWICILMARLQLVVLCTCLPMQHWHSGYSLHLLCLKFVFISNQVLITCQAALMTFGSTVISAAWHVMSTWLDIKTNWRQSKSAALLKSRCCVEASKHNSQRRHKTSLAVRKDTQEAHVNLSNQLAATPC